jgi:pimeloyl-ACP methyl ester carboxylesterase
MLNLRDFFDKVLKYILYPQLNISHSTLKGDAFYFRELQFEIPNLEDKFVKAADGHDVRIWFARNTQPAGRTKIYLHGNASSIACFYKEANEDYQQGYNICLMSYRGYSSTPGKPSHEGLMADANAVFDFLIKEQGIAPASIDVEAHSLGCAIALHTLASRKESFGEVLLLAPFSSIRDIVKDRLKPLPQGLIDWLTNVWNNTEALDAIKDRVSSLTIMHGTKDEIIPYEQSRRLHEVAQLLEIKSRLIILDDIKHNNISRDLVVEVLPEV